MSIAENSLARLIDVCKHKTGQSYKVRGLLYSLWNGKAYSLLEILSLDYGIRADVLNVAAAFGAPTFFYREIKRAFEQAGLFDWFCEEGESK